MCFWPIFAVFKMSRSFWTRSGGHDRLYVSQGKVLKIKWVKTDLLTELGKGNYNWKQTVGGNRLESVFALKG